MKSWIALSSMILLTWMAIPLFAQQEEITPSQFDFGKMWTFEHAPVDYFAKTYNFKPDANWLEKTRMSSIRFATYCSGSFISKDGLILTNHHCSRDAAGGAMQEGEDFDLEGFYASSQEEERRVEGLFVKQLRKMEDITKFVKGYTDGATSDEDFKALQKKALEAATEEYQKKSGWEDLEVETVTYYSGGKYSMYGYKRFDDIRLVLLPEQSLGAFGGDPDNFTYPRYSLDYTLWRAYEDGKPLNTSDFYFPILEEGAEEGELIFAIGNPARTERYHTVAQLNYDGNYRYNVFLEYLKNRNAILKAQNEADPDYQREGLILNLQNSIKAYSGIVKGLNDPYLMGKKEAMEKQIRAKSQAVKDGNDYWKQMEEVYDPLEETSVERMVLRPTPFSGSVVQLAHNFASYRDAVEEGKSQEDLDALKDQVKQTAAKLGDDYEVEFLASLLDELQRYADPGEDYFKQFLNGKSPTVAAKSILEETLFKNEKKTDKLLDGKLKKMQKSNDPIIRMANVLVPKYREAAVMHRNAQSSIEALEEKVANEVFQVYGLNIPPDATFTLRIADGVVKGYPYNGTMAPYKSTYFGLYDRHYANNGKAPWDLPKKWMNPSMELLKSPVTFVATSDSIGGSSGSPVINQKGQLVGVLFDGNIESLPGNFIYDPNVNRSVMVHAGGILASMEHVYKAQRILEELGVQ